MNADRATAIREVLAEATDADVAVREVVRGADEPHLEFAAIAFVEEGSLVVGPSAGTADPARTTAIPIRFNGDLVGELWLDGDVPPYANEVGAAVAPYVLLGWDTGGEAWEP